jgi:hypothetical protein
VPEGREKYYCSSYYSGCRAKERGQVYVVFAGRTRQGIAGLIVNWQRPRGQNISRKVGFDSSRCQESGLNIITAVGVVVVEQKREGLIRSMIVGMT